MFLFPDFPQNDPLGRLVPPDDGKQGWASHNISILHRADGADHLRSLNVPFCINLMTDGQYDIGQRITFTSISDKENFSLKKTNRICGNIAPKECMEMHHHDYFELVYVHEGEVEYHIESGCFTYPKGKVCLLNRNTRHYEVLGENCFLVFLCLSKDFIQDSILLDSESHILQTQLLHFFNSNLNETAQYQKDYLEFTPVSLTPNGTPRLSALIDELAKELLLKQVGHTYVVLGLLSRLLALLQDPAVYTCNHIILNSSAEAYLFSKITHFMESKTGRVTRAELAEYLNYSSDHINRIVKRHSGMSISEYNQVICLKKAERLLIETNESISSIIIALGFENKSHFYRIFDKKHGITPLEYRKRHALA